MDSITGMMGVPRYHQTSEFSPSGQKYLISTFSQKVDGTNKECIIKGEMSYPVMGWEYKLYGKWTESDRGLAFSFESFEPPKCPASHEGMADYLARQVPLVGKVRARYIVDHFGSECFHILKTDPSRVAEVKKMTSVAIDAAKAYFKSVSSDVDPQSYARLFDLLSPIRPPRKIVMSLLKNFGSNAAQFVKDNPYKLLDYPGMGWDRVDKFALRVLNYDPNGIERHKQAALEVLARNASYGHTKIDMPTLECDSSNLLEVALNPETVNVLNEEVLTVTDEDKFISSWYLFSAEQTIANEIERLQETFEDDIPCITDDELEDEQTLVPEMVSKYPVSILSGVPGAGKSYAVARIIKRLHEKDIEDILVIAPTGKAAKRNKELLDEIMSSIDIPCMTIHRALKSRLSEDDEEGIPEDEAKINRGRDKFRFSHGTENQLPYKFFVVDEASMADSVLAAAFLSAVPDGSRVLICGDHHQLPSVGPGSVLRDLIASGVPSVILDKPRRNSGTIAQACYEIKEGRKPKPEGNWTHIEQEDESKIFDSICNIHRRYNEKNGFESVKLDLQVASPEKKGMLGCNSLNAALSKILNPTGESQSKLSEDDGQIRIGDKVVRNQNGPAKCLIRDILEDSNDFDLGSDIKTMDFNGEEYIISECYLVNGDSGEVAGFTPTKIIVRFFNPTRLCVLPKADAKISLFYAGTVHKLQGSGFPNVIMPLWNFYWNPKLNTGLYNRELVYTALSRPIKNLITVGPIRELYKAIDRPTTNQRLTRLREFLNGKYQQTKV
jgi:exodeoxyribonuclease V alpha subunit